MEGVVDLAEMLQDRCNLTDDSDSDSENDVDNSEDLTLGISEDLARWNYENAGEEVPEEKEKIQIKKYDHLMNSNVDAILNRVLAKLSLPYNLVDFQRVAVNALGQCSNVVLISPTGSGKMNVALLAALVLKEVLNVPKGVAIVTQPLSSIMVEKLKNNLCNAAVLSMTGDVTTSIEGNDASLSVSLDDLFDGKIDVIFGHPESFDSKLGQFILRKLQKLGRLVLICLDEVHQSAKGHWDSFR